MTNKGLTIDLNVKAIGPDFEPVKDFRKRSLTGMPVEGSEYEMTLADVVISVLNSQAREESATLDDIRKRMRLVAKIRAHKDRPVTLHTENWNYIRSRMVTLKTHPVLIGQLDACIEGEITDKDLEDL